MRKVVTLLITMAVAIGVPAAAAARDVNRKSPPRLSLRYHDEVVQRSRPYTFCWSYSNDDDTATGMCADGLPRYPRAARVTAPARLSVRIHYPVKPDEWYLHAYRAVIRRDYYDETVGDGERIPFRLRPHRVNGTIRAWNVVFRVEEPIRHYYLDIGGNLAQGDVHYTLHVRT